MAQDYLDARQEVRQLAAFQGPFDVGLTDERQQGRNVLRVHVAEARRDVGDPVVFVAEVVDRDPLGRWDVRRGLGLDRQDEDVLVQDVVVLDVRSHRQRGGVLAAVEEDGGAGYPRQRGLHGVELLDERRERPLVAYPLLGDELAAPLPGGEDGERDDADQQGKPCSVHQLGQVGGEEEQGDGDQDAAARQHDPQRPAPLMTGVVEEQQGRAGDRAGYGRAVGIGQPGRAPEREHEREHRDQQQPVDERDVDLAHHLFRGVFDAQPGQVAQSGGLLRDRVGAGDDGLRGDDRGHGGEEDHREPGPARRQEEERAAGVALVAQDEGALADVVPEAGGEDDQQPGPPDRRAAEVPHVRVYRLGPGDGQDDGGQREE